MPDLMQHPASPPPMPAVVAILARYDRQKIEDFIEVAIGLLDTLDGDPEEQQENGDENDDPGDLKDTAYPEWTTRGRHKLYGGQYEHPNGMGEHVAQEDTEDDDPDTSAEDAPEGFDGEEDGCLAGEDRIVGGAVREDGMSCFTDKSGDDVDEERQQLEHDVPCLPVISLEPNPFSGQRQLLGYTLPRPTRDGMEAEL